MTDPNHLDVLFRVESIKSSDFIFLKDFLFTVLQSFCLDLRVSVLELVPFEKRNQKIGMGAEPFFSRDINREDAETFLNNTDVLLN